MHARIQNTLDHAVTDILFTQHCARVGTLTQTPRWPMIILRTPKVRSLLLPKLSLLGIELDDEKMKHLSVEKDLFMHQIVRCK